MLVNLYSILDIKAQVFGRPFQEHNHNTCKRAFAQAVQTPQSPYNEHPEDYLLFHIAVYNDNTGVIEPQGPERIWSASEALQAGGGQRSAEGSPPKPLSVTPVQSSN